MTNNFILKHIVENHYACPLSQRETARLSSTPFTPAISRSPGNDELDQSLTNYPIFELIIQVNVLLRVICSGNAVRVVTRMNANCEQKVSTTVNPIACQDGAVRSCKRRALGSPLRCVSP